MIAHVTARALVTALALAEIGRTRNFYREGAGASERRRRLERYLHARREAPILLVGEAPGYRGTCVSGIPFTSESQLTGRGPGEASASIVHRVLVELGLAERVVLWNVVPTHPHRVGQPASNRRPTAGEVRAGVPWLEVLAEGRRVIPVGRLAHAALGGPYVRHPSHGGATAFRAGLLNYLA